MARDDLHKWAQTITVLAGIIFAAGGYGYLTVNNVSAITIEKTERIKAVENISKDVKQNCSEIKQLQIDQQREIALKAQMISLLSEINNKIEKTNTEQTQMKIDLGSIKVKVDTLIKD